MDTSAITSLPITAGDLAPITTMFNQAVGIALNIGIPIMATMIGLRFVPKLVKKWAK